MLRFTPLFILILLVGNVFASCDNSRKLNKAIEQKAYIYVETAGGETIKAKPVEEFHREPTAIASFAEQWLLLAFSWNDLAELPENYVIENRIKYPYSFYLASLAIKPGYRESYLHLLTEKYREDFEFNRYISGEYQSLVRIFDEPIVLPVEDKTGKTIEGIWDVKIVATRTHSRGKIIIAHEKFNRTIRVQAIRPVSENEAKVWGDTDLGQFLQQLQKKGLQVVEIAEF